MGGGALVLPIMSTALSSRWSFRRTSPSSSPTLYRLWRSSWNGGPPRFPLSTCRWAPLLRCHLFSNPFIPLPGGDSDLNPTAEPHKWGQKSAYCRTPAPCLSRQRADAAGAADPAFASAAAALGVAEQPAGAHEADQGLLEPRGGGHCDGPGALPPDSGPGPVPHDVQDHGPLRLWHPQRHHMPRPSRQVSRVPARAHQRRAREVRCAPSSRARKARCAPSER